MIVEMSIQLSKVFKEKCVPFLQYYSMGKALNIKKIAKFQIFLINNIIFEQLNYTLN